MYLRTRLIRPNLDPLAVHIIALPAWGRVNEPRNVSNPPDSAVAGAIVAQGGECPIALDRPTFAPDPERSPSYSADRPIAVIHSCGNMDG